MWSFPSAHSMKMSPGRWNDG